jgi:hypothetical protein
MNNFEELTTVELNEVKGGIDDNVYANATRTGGRTVGAGQITEIVE